jgi:hypothetical protein
VLHLPRALVWSNEVVTQVIMLNHTLPKSRSIITKLLVAQPLHIITVPQGIE